MKVNNYVSKKEHRLLLIVAFTAFVYVVSAFTFEAVNGYNQYISEQQNVLKNQADGKPNLRFSGTDGINQIPGLHILTLFIFAALLKTKRFLLPVILTVFYATGFIYSLFVRANYSGFDSPNFLQSSFFEQIYLVSNLFDFLAFFFILILLFWQISILLRMLIKTLQRKRVLP